MIPRPKSLFNKLLPFKFLIIWLFLSLSACDVRVLISSSFDKDIKQIEEENTEVTPPTPPAPPEIIETNDSILAILTGLPTPGSGDDFLSITVAGTEVTQYRYKFGPTSTTECQNPSGYSSSIDTSQQIEDSLINYYIESLKICVVGLNSQGEIQSYNLATEYIWTRTMINEVFVAQSGVTINESIAPTVINFTLRSIYPATLPITIDYEFYGDLVEPLGLTSGQTTILAGQSSVTVSVPLMATPAKNTDSYLRLGVSNVSATGGYSDYLTSSVYIIDSERVTSQSVISISPNLHCAVLDNGHLICTGEIGTSNSSGRRFASGWKRIGAPILYKSVVADSSHRCAISVSDEMYCWGWGFDGQLGLGTNSDHAEPQRIEGIQWKSATSAGNVTCGISTLDDLYCWGDQTYTSGLAGNGLTTDQRSPLNIDPSLKYEKVVMINSSGSSGSACAISKPDGILKCWGANFSYRLGDGTTENRSSPVTIDPGQSYKDVSFGASSVCGLTISGAIKCWGKNLDKSSSTTTLTVPTLVDDNRVYSKISVEPFMSNSTLCALSEGRPYCYGTIGSSNFNQMTLMDTSSELYEDIANNYLLCGLTTTQRIKCWRGTSFNQDKIFSKYYKYSDGAYWSDDLFNNLLSLKVGLCGITTFGQLKCSQNGQSRPFGSTGHHTPSIRSPAVPYGTTVDFLDISSNCLIRSSDKKLSCWGYQINLARASQALEVKQIGKKFSSGSQLCTLLQSDEIACIHGSSKTVTYIAQGSFYSNLSTNRNFNCAITRDSQTIQCWGSNSSGQLGVGDTISRDIPTSIASSEQFTKVMTEAASSGGGGWACALTTTRALYCWGNNPRGLGSGVTSSLTPVQVLPGTTFTDFAIERVSACAIRETDGRVLCWGEGGALGVSSFSNRSTPDVTSDTESYVNIFAGAVTSTNTGFCGSTSTHTKCWGYYIGSGGHASTPIVVLDQPAASVTWSGPLYLKGLDGKLYLLGNTNNILGSPNNYFGFEPLMGLYDQLIPDWSL